MRHTDADELHRMCCDGEKKKLACGFVHSSDPRIQLFWTLRPDQGSDIYMYIYSLYFLSDLWNFKTNGKNVCTQGMGRVLINIMTGHRCQRFLCLRFMFSCHSASSPFICHDKTSFKQSSTKEPAIVAEGYLMCQCFLAFCCGIFSGYSLESSRDCTEVHPVLAAGWCLAYLPEPRWIAGDWFRDRH